MTDRERAEKLAKELLNNKGIVQTYRDTVIPGIRTSSTVITEAGIKSIEAALKEARRAARKESRHDR